MAREIVIEGQGPIERLRIPLPEKGGVAVLSGGPGAGKSTALAAISQAVGGKKSGVTVNDKSKSGSVSIDGAVVMKVTRSRTTSGNSELEIEALDSKLDISALVDPGILDPERADAARIKALVNMTGVKADETAFYDLVGGKEKFDSLGVDTDTTDPVVLAKRVKAALDKLALKYEKKSAELRGEVIAVVGESLHITEVKVPEEAEIRTALDEANRVLVDLESRQREYEKQSKAIADATASMQSIGESESVDELEAKLKLAEAFTERCRSQFEAAKQKQLSVELALSNARKLDEQRKNHLRVLESVRVQSVESMIPAAKAEVEMYQTALANAAVLRQKAVSVEAAKKAKAGMAHYAERAEHIRTLAAKTNDILTELIPPCSLKVDDGRLVIATDRSEKELYAELSEGERWTTAIELAADNLPENGLIVIPQVAWDGLNVPTQKHIAERAKYRGVVIVTAKISEGPLTVETME